MQVDEEEIGGVRLQHCEREERFILQHCERLREIVCKSSHTSRMNCQRGSDTNDDYAEPMMIIEHTIVLLLNILI